MSQYNAPDKQSGDQFSASEHNQLKAAVNSKADLNEITELLENKQDVLISEVDIKTINGQTLLGPGNISISGNGGTVQWDSISNKPSTFSPSPHTHTLSEITQSGATQGDFAYWDGAKWTVAIPQPNEADFSVNGNVKATKDGDKLRLDTSLDGTILNPDDIPNVPNAIAHRGYVVPIVQYTNDLAIRDEQIASLYAQVAALTTTFDPNVVPGLFLGINPGDNSKLTLVNSNQVSSVTDLSGFSNDLSAYDSTSRPTIVLKGGGNNHSYITFNGSRGLANSAIAFADGAVDITSFYVIRRTGNDNAYRPLYTATNANQGTSNWGAYFADNGPSSVFLVGYNGGNQGTAIGTTTAFDNPLGWVVLRIQHWKSQSNDEVTIYLDGTRTGQTNANQDNIDNFNGPFDFVIGSGSQANPLQVDIRYALHYARAAGDQMSSAHIMQIESFLATLKN